MNLLFKKGHIGSCQIKNRVVMPPMTTGFTGVNGEVTPELIHYYEERAKGGVGLIYSEIFMVDTVHGRASRRQLHTQNPAYISSLNRLTTAVHKYGAKMFAQLHHGGNTNKPELNQGVIYSASDVPTVTRIVPTPLTVEQIKELEEKFIETAINCKKAGFDGVELHCAHGYLPLQFMSASTNHRNDEYGGSLENRCRFPVEIITGIKMACGKNFPVTVRLSVDEYDPYHPDAIKLEEGIEIAKILEAAGVDAISATCCNYFSTQTSIEPYSFQQGWRKANSIALKNALKIPVISTNTIKEPEFAEKLLEENVCDFVAVGRGHLADPEWVRKAKENRTKDIRKCIGCLYCFEHLGANGSIRCSVNPRLGNDLSFEKAPEKNGNNRQVVVVGGGPAGLQAATILAQRNFKVTLFEKEAKLGGAMLLAGLTAPYKEKILWLLETMTREAEQAGVEIRLNTPATIEEVKKLEPVGVFLAAGADPVVPSLPGITSSKVLMAADVINEKVSPTGKIAVIGGGLTGLETAEFLCNTGKAEEITIVDMLPALGAGIYFVVFQDVLNQLAPYAPHMMPGHKIEAVTDNGVTLTNIADNTQVDVDADYVVLAMGLKPNAEMVKGYEEAFDRVVVLGENERAPGRIATSIQSGFVAAYGFDPEV